MIFVMDFIHLLFPLVSLAALCIALATTKKNFLTIALSLSLAGIILDYQSANGEMLGNYFNYKNALIFTINGLVFLSAFVALVLNLVSKATSLLIRYINGLISAFIAVGLFIFFINIWINAYFIQNRMAGTPILQVGTFKTLDYCNYPYIFYKISEQEKINYLCPRYYGLFPATGELKTIPDYLIKQLPLPLQTKFKP